MMKAFNRCFRLLSNSPAIQAFYREISVFFLSRGKTRWARLFLDKIDDNHADKRKTQYLILSYLMDEDWKAFFPLLSQAGYKQTVIQKIRDLVRRMKKTNRTFHTLNVMDKIIPGISYGYSGSPFLAGESILFHGFLIYQVIAETTVLGNVIYGFNLLRLYTRTIAHSRAMLVKKWRKRKLRLEGKIFDQLVSGGQF